MTSIDTTTWRCGPPPRKGQRQRYPSRFLLNLQNTYPVTMREDVLHMFSGSTTWGHTTDLRPATGCTFAAMYDRLLIRDNTYAAVVADPPYSKGFSNEWVTLAKHVPRPGRILGEATRVVKPEGYVFILHVIVIPAYRKYNVRRVALHPVLCGPNNAVRVLNVFQKRHDTSA